MRRAYWESESTATPIVVIATNCARAPCAYVRCSFTDLLTHSYDNSLPSDHLPSPSKGDGNRHRRPNELRDSIQAVRVVEYLPRTRNLFQKACLLSLEIVSAVRKNATSNEVTVLFRKFRETRFAI